MFCELLRCLFEFLLKCIRSLFEFKSLEYYTAIGQNEVSCVVGVYLFRLETVRNGLLSFCNKLKKQLFFSQLSQSVNIFLPSAFAILWLHIFTIVLLFQHVSERKMTHFHHRVIYPQRLDVYISSFSNSLAKTNIWPKRPLINRS